MDLTLNASPVYRISLYSSSSTSIRTPTTISSSDSTLSRHLPFQLQSHRAGILITYSINRTVATGAPVTPITLVSYSPISSFGISALTGPENFNVWRDKVMGALRVKQLE